jgi:hypothetical protein
LRRWLARLLRRIHELADRGQVRLTLKAMRELAALGVGLDVQDACDVVAALTVDRRHGRVLEADPAGRVLGGLVP